MGSSTKRFKVDSVSSGVDTGTFYKTLEHTLPLELDSGMHSGNSNGHSKQSKSIMSNGISKHGNGHTSNIQLVSKSNSQNENLPCEVSCIPSDPNLSTVGLTGASSLNHEKKCLDSKQQPRISEELSKLPVRRAPSNSMSTEKSLKGIRILLAEDTPVLQRVATIMLEKMGASVVAVGDGLQAVDALKCHYNVGDFDKWSSINKATTNGNHITSGDHPPFDLILMDCQMPKMDGYEATKVIRLAEEGTGHHLPIVALTAHAMSSDEAKCLEVGMDAYLTKPIDSKLMASTILTLTRRKK
uniref:Response regulatory domain-containing protein n=1 Tax=Araucaria cunninghamii TaxID=56994 RepID=A0A0D6R700_ARACU